MLDASKTWVVECYVPGVDEATVRRSADRAAAEVRRLGPRQGDIEYLGALLMAVDEVVLHAFRATDPDLVRRAGTAAGLEFERVVESIEVLPVPLIQPSARSSGRPASLLEPREVPS